MIGQVAFAIAQQAEIWYNVDETKKGLQSYGSDDASTSLLSAQEDGAIMAQSRFLGKCRRLFGSGALEAASDG